MQDVKKKQPIKLVIVELPISMYSFFYSLFTQIIMVLWKLMMAKSTIAMQCWLEQKYWFLQVSAEIFFYRIILIQ